MCVGYFKFVELAYEQQADRMVGMVRDAVVPLQQEIAALQLTIAELTAAQGASSE
jgi:hypothetical protein